MPSNELTNWLESFWKILIFPSTKTFAKEAEKANGKFGSSVAWLVFLAVYIVCIAMLLVKDYPFNFLLLIVLVMAIPAAVVTLTSAMHLVYQRVFHGKQYIYDALLYITTIILIPFQMIAIPLSLAVPVEIGNPIFDLMQLYQLALLVWSLTVISKLKLWQAAITVLIGTTVGAITLVCILPIVVSMMGGVSAALR